MGNTTEQNAAGFFRLEHDFLGERPIPADAYYGVQTLRAKENFDITGVPISHAPEMIRALAYVKKAAALANLELNIIPENVGKAIAQACDEILAGKLHDHFIVDMIQGGAGTSTNMNANEVIANRANELLGSAKGLYAPVHPNNHVNCSQSTNDAYPTAFRLALNPLLSDLTEKMVILQSAFQKKAEEFSDVVKMGRTQLQDAVPMTLGQEFGAYATTIGEDVQRVREARSLVLEINMGATAIGTGINAPPEYTRQVTEHLRKLTGIPVITSPNLIEATWDTGAYVQISGILKRVATKLSKICNDLRLLSSGPRCGLNEINLPKMQPGSSIMPGKVNPVIPEVVNQVAFQVIGNDLTITFAAEHGQLELNVMEPVIAYNLFQSIEILKRACQVLASKCVDGITANREHCRSLVENSVGIVTALVPALGYETSAAIAKEALSCGRSIKELVLDKKLLTPEKLDELLSIENMVQPRFVR
ncbi:MAG TPA: aspartate ammonia-lyase [Bdellovibrionales bacterium]|nr:MAG: aspartate ammonia-lyase [Bdellovibrionales bacterium GWB1_52_6]OFZ03753.1 MAG: aspartate ammonia-lyase [Bdellovibrionales bacterium GWA1_52_35]OFZ34908.1 MAG: aspartate ammonia-lyase [Bdellovibrionales bacterium GWC1_52_8]HAR41447.1 aspartate ammonia-lyase [Bdellovibrionales bacterium]HCM38731.1 aspartate ammonia-lyase [Bdellovibrionales bacterium]